MVLAGGTCNGFSAYAVVTGENNAREREGIRSVYAVSGETAL